MHLPRTDSTSDTPETIWRSAIHFFSGTLFSRITGMVRDVSMAYAFGVQSSLAAFMIAFRFAHFLRRFLGEGALQAVFIPKFESLRTQSPLAAIDFFRDLNKSLFVLLSFLIVMGVALLSLGLWKGSFSSANQEILFLTSFMLPSVLFICLFGVNASLLQCEKMFFVPSCAPVCFNLIWIGIVLCIYFFQIEKAMSTLSWGIILACMGQWGATLPAIKRILHHHGRSLWKGSILFSPSVRSMLSPLFLGVVSILGSQINQLIDSLFARTIAPGGPAILWFASRLQQLPLALFGIALSGAVLPPLSRALKENNISLYRRLLHSAFFRTAALMIPLSGAVFALGLSGTHLVYGRGNFSLQNVLETAQCLRGYGAGLLPSALLLILTPAYFAGERYRMPAFTAFGAVCLNVVFNSYFISYLGWGIVSLTLSTSLISWITVLFLCWRLKETSLFCILKTKSLQQLTAATLIATLLTLLCMISQELPRDFLSQLFLFVKNSSLFITLFALSWSLVSLTSPLKLLTYFKNAEEEFFLQNAAFPG